MHTDPPNPEKPLTTWPMGEKRRRKGRTLHSHLSEVFTPHNTIPDREIESKLTQHTACSGKISAFNITELKQVIKRLHPRKATGPDLVTAHMIQELQSSGLITLLHILNATLRLEYWPTLFKQAKVIMILKQVNHPQKSPPTGQSVSCPSPPKSSKSYY